MKAIVKIVFLLMLVAALFGGFDILASEFAGSATTNGGVTSIQLGVVAPVAAETGACEDGRPGC